VRHAGYRYWILIAVAFAVVVALPAWAVGRTQQAPAAQLEQSTKRAEAPAENGELHEIREGLIRLPLAAVLGTALALRPKRKGTPPRMPAVVQTQIILAVVGAVIMLVVGASLARAFGIVGAANLIRYRSKIDDPKDAVVMLAALAVGLASGVGLYALATFSTAFLMLALGIIESFEKGVKRYELKIKMGDQTDERRPKIENILRRFQLPHEVLASADEEVSYDVEVPMDVERDRVTDAILRLDPEGHAAVDWSEKKNKSK
jgi:uncharacterized membrane protein YhiD involved in acid resistance